MDLLTALVLLNVALLQFEGVWSEEISLSRRTGDDATLSCDKHHGPGCSDVYWYNFGVSDYTLVQNGQIEDIPRSSRLTLNPDCSLTIHNITEEDSGLYRCGLWTSQYRFDWAKQDIHLRVLPGVWSEGIHLYHRPGEETTLSCERFKDHGPKCSSVQWGHQGVKDPLVLVQNGQIEDIPRSSRLTLNPDCSLTVHHITEEDSGRYRCGLQTSPGFVFGNNFYLSVLSVSPAPSSLNQDGLQCRLWRYHELSCPQNSLRWLDTDGTVLSGDGVTQIDCVSSLTVERESQHQRTFTCQFVEDDEVKVSAEFRLEGNSEDTDGTKGNCEESQRSKGWSWFLVLKTVGWSALISATVVVSICTREKGKPKRSSGDFEMVCSPDVGPGNTAPPADYENQP